MQILGENYRITHSYLHLLLSSKWGIMWVFYCCLFVATQGLFAQQIPDNQCYNALGVGSGDFSISSETGCAPFTVKVQNTQVGSTKSRYIYDYKGGNPNATSYKQDTLPSGKRTRHQFATLLVLPCTPQPLNFQLY